MVSFKKLLTTILLSVVYASYSAAAPRATKASRSTHGLVRIGRRGLEIETFAPASTYETFSNGIAQTLSRRQDASLEDLAVSFVQQRLGVDASAVHYNTGFEGATGEYAYVRQKHNGVPFANSVANIAFKNDKVVAFGSSFTKSENIASSNPSITAEAAISAAESALGGTYTKQPVSVEYLARPDGSVALTYAIHIKTEAATSWLVEAFVDAHTAELLSVTDFTAQASYNVVPIHKQDPTQGFEIVTDPADLFSSPLGWHNDSTAATTSTSGNNAISYEDQWTNSSNETSDGLNFIYNLTVTEEPDFPENLDVSRTNAFYIVNTYHDILYRYGFTETAFNFQHNNLGKGGLGNDAVQVSVQAPGEIRDNSGFATLPEGLPGFMFMYIWDKTTPNRDGALSNDILVHEYTVEEPRVVFKRTRLGEGWSDAMAEWTEHTSRNLSDFTLASYVNGGVGFRHYPYSTDPAVNPLVYSDISNLGEVHDAGEIWANLLHNVYAVLLAEHGFSENAYTDPTGTGANVVFAHLFIDALPLQPCNPTFITARDAWIQADVNRYGGANKCLLWKAFASRGLGTDATADYTDSFAIPENC